MENNEKKQGAQPPQEDSDIFLPVLALRGLVFFPGMVMELDALRAKSIAAVQAAMMDFGGGEKSERLICLVTQKDMTEEEPTGENLYRVGVVAKIHNVSAYPDGGLKLHVEGLYRAQVRGARGQHESPFLLGKIRRCPVLAYRRTHRTEAMLRLLHRRFDEYFGLISQMPPEVMLGVLQEKDCGRVSDYLCSNLPISPELKQSILEELRPVHRLEKLIDILGEEIQILRVEAEISQKAQMQMDENQRAYYLREQMRAIAAELGEEDDPRQEAEEIEEEIRKSGMPEANKQKLFKECSKLAFMPYGSHEGSVLRAYLEACLELPWDKAGKENLDLVRAKKILDRDHWGMDKVKERFLEILAVKALAPRQTRQIICLVGPPGVGKTSIARSIAEAIGRKYVRVSLGGVSDEAEIMGHRRTYVGSMSGRIINAVKQAGVNNPLLLLDEIDKLGQNFRGDPSSALLEVLDPEQNKEFTDHYIDLPFDLSNVLFITTANDASRIPGPLYDRMDIIELGSYTLEEKLNIATRHLVKKQLKANGLKSSQLKFTRAGLREMIEGYTREAGVRSLERLIASVCRKVARQVVSEEGFAGRTVKPADLEELLGPRKFTREPGMGEDTIGLVNGLAWTSVGGELLPIEVAVMEGNGKIQLTGSLGEVMKESANAAITCIRTRAKALGISPSFYEKCDIHVHAPEGAVPKDGPSAGTAMATAITSALCGVPVRANVAMTGEITLQGRVLPIGGLREKAMAAYKHGIDTVLIPEENLPDLAEVDEAVKAHVRFVPVKQIDAVLENALRYMPKPAAAEETGRSLPVEKGSARGGAPEFYQ